MNKNNQMNNDEIVIDLFALFKALWKKKGIIIFISLLGAIIAAYISLFMIKPMYRTEFNVYVNNRSNDDYYTSTSSSDVTAARSLASTYAEIIEGRAILLEAAENCGMGNVEYKDLQKLVDAETSTTSELISVYVKGATPTNALYLAQAVAISAETHFEEIFESASMKIVNEPYFPEERFSPSNSKNTIIGFAIGLFLVCGIIVLKEILDDRVKDETTIEERFGIPVLGTIPNYHAAGKNNDSYYYSSSDGSGENKKKKKTENKEKGGNQ